MKNFLKIILSVCLCGCIAVFSVGCNNKGETSSNSPSLITDTVSAFPTLNAMSLTGESDCSYGGTDTSKGFSSVKSRTGSTFETYPEGYGQNTTGGRGATAENIYTCSSFTEVETAVSTIKDKVQQDDTVKSIILIAGEIVERTSVDPTTQTETLDYQLVIDSVKNLSILGANENAVFNGVGINFKSSDNLIVQNVTIHHPSNTLKNEKDCLEFNKCNNVWVDHCEFYNNYPSNSAEKDYYDGLVDVKNESSNVTISYNYMHDSFKTSLVGSGPDDVVETRTLTYHHNVFENCNSRLPLIRGGYAHIYNNYYNNILSAGINTRIGAQVYVENNVFNKVKNPICSIEETLGFYNQVGNVFTDCVPVSSTLVNGTNYTPSYEYTLDGTESLVSYLNETVGVNKINVEVAKANAEARAEYVIPEYKIVSRSIDEIGEVKYNNETFQKLRYLSNQVINLNGETIARIANIQKLITAVDEYNKLEAKQLDAKIELINTNGAFSKNATKTYDCLKEYENVSEFVQAYVQKYSILKDAVAYYRKNFIMHFNGNVLNLTEESDEGKLEETQTLLNLYNNEGKIFQDALEIEKLQEQITKYTNLVARNQMVTLAEVLPTAENVLASDKPQMEIAIAKYNSLTETQLALFKQSDSYEKYVAVCSAYEIALKAVRTMDLSGVSEGQTSTETTVCGGVNVGIRTIIKKGLSVEYSGNTFTEAVYLSGYGNTGSKCLQFTLYAKSDLKLVLASENAGATFTVSDANKNVINTFSTENADVTTVELKDLEEGEYRIFTNMPDETHTSIKAFFYQVTITPQN